MRLYLKEVKKENKYRVGISGFREFKKRTSDLDLSKLEDKLLKQMIKKGKVDFEDYYKAKKFFNRFIDDYNRFIDLVESNKQ